MSIISDAKEITDLVKALGNAELYRKIVELEGQIVELSREKYLLQTEKENVERLLSVRNSMKFVKPFYIMENDDVPYCAKCWEVASLTVHLNGPYRTQSGFSFDCPNCKTRFFNSP